jgi:hypothetical protein
MAKRDPDKTARNRIIAAIKEQLRSILPKVTVASGGDDEATINARIGYRTDLYIDLKNDIIRSQDEYVSKWMTAFKANEATDDLWALFRKSSSFRKYLQLFLQRSYLKHFEELSKKRPRVEESEMWIGQLNADYGLLVTPRWTGDEWENDKSEIRAFKQGYWTIGHVMQTGLVIPDSDEPFEFASVKQYLQFFRDTLVRNSGSPYERKIAGYYCDYVLQSPKPLDVPLMIPEFRYLGRDPKHIHRLDFTIVNPFTLDKVGFELSPWSTHGELKGIKKMTQKKVNETANANREKEFKKHRDYFKKHNVFALIYTDTDLKDCKKLFDEEIRPYLEPENPDAPISHSVMEEFL